VPEIGPHKVTAPGSVTSPRQCLPRGIMKERGPGWRLCLRAGEVATERLDAGAWPACTATHFYCCTASAEESGLRPFRAGLGDVGLGRRFSLPAAEYAVPSGHLLAPPLLAFRNPRDVARHAAPKALTAVADFDCRAFAFAAIIRPCTVPAPWGFLLSHGDFFISTPELFASAGVM
jgi:hypothetical protein